MTRGQVLVVEDDLDAAKIVVRRLVADGFTCLAVESGHEALAALRARRFDAALVDLGLPDMSGIDLLERLRELEPGLPVLMMTAQGADPFVDLAMERGASAYLVKPIGRREMAAALDAAVGVDEV